jgi:GTP diphosphokinase / guanosine-3',5'-bis(diphosphate) 3'-diphosphatase
MLERINAILAQYSTEAAFLELVAARFGSNEKGHALIVRAFRTAFKAHKGSLRLDGRPTFSHPVAVAILLIEYAQVPDPEVIAAALLHLFIEDVEGWNFYRLHATFGFRVAQHVEFVSKQPGEDEKNWKARTALSHDKLLHAPVYTQMLKLFDRFNNLLSIFFLPKWKQKRMLRDTVEFYVPLSEKLGVLEKELLEAIKRASRAD